VKVFKAWNSPYLHDVLAIEKGYGEFAAEIKGRIRKAQYSALKDVKKPIGVSTHKMTAQLPHSLSKYLPSGREISERLCALDGG